MSSVDNRLDIIIYGATGFTGRYTVEEIVKLADERSSLTWGISGRNRGKLESLVKDISEKTGKDLSKIPVLVADNDDIDSLCEMATKARVVVNCVGPYRFYGEPVIKACIASGTHHVDVSGEPQYMERMQLEYHDSAKAKGIYIVSACGFDSIPTDLGIVYFSQKFGGEVNSVETYLSSKCEALKKGASIHYGTWESAVYGLAHASELVELRRKLYPDRMPRFQPVLKARQSNPSQRDCMYCR